MAAGWRKFSRNEGGENSNYVEGEVWRVRRSVRKDFARTRIEWAGSSIVPASKSQELRARSLLFQHLVAGIEGEYGGVERGGGEAADLIDELLT